MRIDKLDSMRGVAALAVVFGHCLASYDFGTRTNFLASAISYSPLALFWDGNAAVIVFFILSGYVLSLAYYSGCQLPYSKFLVRRVCRIYLPFAAVTLIAAAILARIDHVAPAGTSPNFIKIWGPVSWEVVAHNLAMTGLHNTINPPIWSLIVEMRISIVFPLLMLIAIRLPWHAALGAALVYSIAASRLESMAVPYWLSSFGGTSRFVMLFVAGALIAKHRNDIASAYASSSTAVRAALVVLAFILWYSQHMSLPFNLSGYVPWIGVALMFVIAANDPMIGDFLQLNWLKMLGRISYSLYLVHAPVIVAMCTQAVFLPLEARLLLVPVVSIAVAYACYLLIEKPSMRLGATLARAQPAKRQSAPA